MADLEILRIACDMALGTPSGPQQVRIAPETLRALLDCAASLRELSAYHGKHGCICKAHKTAAEALAKLDRAP